jgi:thiamine-phosphate pyrophosphorylase
MVQATHAISGLYAITPDCADTAQLLRLAEDALSGGADVLQYRNKRADKLLRLNQAERLLELTRQFSVPLIINDDIDLALQINAEGVHLGATDAKLSHARDALGRQKIIGISCYNSMSRAREAVSAGADYLAFGSFYSSRIKPDAVTASVDLLRAARAEFDIALVAIGGITLQNAAPLIRAGADAVAVISALFDVADIKSTARIFSELFNQSTT